MKKWKLFGGTVFLVLFFVLFMKPVDVMAGTIITNMSANAVQNNYSEGDFTEGLGTLTTGYTYYANLAVTSDVKISKATITFYRNGSWYHSHTVCPEYDYFRFTRYEIAFDNPGSYSYKWAVEYLGGGSQEMNGSFTVQNFTLYFNANGGSVSPGSKGVKYGEAIGTLPTPTRTGYSFDGWYTSASGGDRIESSSRCLVAYTGSGSSNSITLYAHWTANKYTVYFNANGGSVSTGSKSVTYNRSYGTLPTPSRTGYTFAGWYTTASGGSQKTSGSTVTTAGSHTLYAHWAANKYTVYFNANGGSVSTGSKSVTYNRSYGTLPTPSRTGYTFAGWYTTASGGSQKTSGSTVTTAGSHTLYAHWTVNKYTVYFNANGGNVGTGSKSVTYNSSYGTLPTPSRTGYTFAGWYTTASGGSRKTSGSTVTTAGSHTLYAHWTANKYTVYFNANGGSVGTQSKSVAYNSSYGTLPTPSRTGYTFAGWYTTASGGSRKTSGSTVTTAESHTLYAHWTKKAAYTVTFQANGGKTLTKNKTVTAGESYGTLPAPTRTGYTFVGWYTQKSGGNAVNASSKVTAGKDHTLYAHWKANSYTVKFQANGGACKVGSKQVVYQKTYGALPTPSRSNYKFQGWYTKKNGGTKVNANTTVKITKTQTLYAHWNVIKPKTTKITVKLVSANEVKVSWKKVSGANGYAVYRSESKNGSYRKCAEVKNGALSYNDKRLKAGKTYYYKVSAYRSAGGKKVYGSQSAPAKKQIIGTLAQPVQNLISVNRQDKTFTISWKPIKHAQKIEIYRSVDGGAAKKVKMVSADTGRAVFSYAKLPKGHAYTFLIRAYYKADGITVYSEYSNGYVLTIK